MSVNPARILGVPGGSLAVGASGRRDRHRSRRHWEVDPDALPARNRATRRSRLDADRAGARDHRRRRASSGDAAPTLAARAQAERRAMTARCWPSPTARVFEGTGFGAAAEAIGEVVFNTSMTGYQEILTDPSYCGQLVAMTYPEIGNIGVNPEDVESRAPTSRASSSRSTGRRRATGARRQSLGDYLAAHGIPGIQGIDTRALVRLLRDKGNLNGVLSTRRPRPATAWCARRARRRAWKGRTWSTRVTCDAPYDWDEGHWTLEHGYADADAPRRRTSSSPTTSASSATSCATWSHAGCRVRVVPAAHAGRRRAGDEARRRLPLQRPGRSRRRALRR